MCMSCKIDIDDVWLNLSPGQGFKTPDNMKGSNFTVQSKDSEIIKIRTKRGTAVPISRQAFENTLHHLRIHNHYLDNPCEIRSNNDRELAGPLCVASRDGNRNVRCINYILPILESFGIVVTDGKRPNKTWLVD